MVLAQSTDDAHEAERRHGSPVDENDRRSFALVDIGDVAAVYRDPADAQTQRRGAAHRLTRAARWLHVHGTGYATET
jgi:hypothetical protein